MTDQRYGGAVTDEDIRAVVAELTMPAYRFLAVLFAVLFLLDHVGRRTPRWVSVLGVIGACGLLLVAVAQVLLIHFTKKRYGV
jgi:hypothetical protein